MKKGSMKQPKVKMVMFEENRTLELEETAQEMYYAWSYAGEAKGFDELSEAVSYAHNRMGKVWKNGYQCFWERGNRLTRKQLDGFSELESIELSESSLAQCMQLLLRQKQIYTDVQASLDAGMAVWEILSQELGTSVCLLPECSLEMTKYYISNGAPVMAMMGADTAVLIVGYDQQNIIYYEPGQTVLKKMGNKDGAAVFESAGNLFFTYLP